LKKDKIELISLKHEEGGCEDLIINLDASPKGKTPFRHDIAYYQYKKVFRERQRRDSDPPNTSHLKRAIQRVPLGRKRREETCRVAMKKLRLKIRLRVEGKIKKKNCAAEFIHLHNGRLAKKREEKEDAVKWEKEEARKGGER